MTNDIKIPEFNLPTKIKTFFNTLLSTFFVVLLVHVTFLSTYAFIEYDMSLVVSGFDFSQWTASGRTLILVPYVILPLTKAICKVAGFNLTDMHNTLLKLKKLCGQVGTKRK